MLDALGVPSPTHSRKNLWKAIGIGALVAVNIAVVVLLIVVLLQIKSGHTTGGDILRTVKADVNAHTKDITQDHAVISQLPAADKYLGEIAIEFVQQNNWITACLSSGSLQSAACANRPNFALPAYPTTTTLPHRTRG